MAQTKKKRKRKHRGTQGGRVDPNRRQGRPRNRQEARARAKTQRVSRFERPPTWRSAAIRGVVAAVLFVFLVLVVFGRPPREAISFGVLMLIFYIPAGYYIDRAMWRRRERTQIRSEKKD